MDCNTKPVTKLLAKMEENNNQNQHRRKKLLDFDKKSCAISLANLQSNFVKTISLRLTLKKKTRPHAIRK